ncbi:MAG: RhuM family protein [Bacteroidota bacterium]|nr:RhuM family protein [Bacteroidota bacterium]
MAGQGEIILYQSEDSTKLEVRIEDETVWLTQAQMVDLFHTTKQNVSLHINNIFKENELTKDSTVKEYLTVRQEGARVIKRKVEFFNLDVIISVGYRVKSLRGTQFRIWANQVLKEYLMKGYVLNHRVDRIEKKILEHDQKFDLLIKTSLPPHEGIFYDGQIFDAYKFAADLVKSAKKSIVLIDNYVDESVLLSKRTKGVMATIYTARVPDQLQLDLDKFNRQYDPIEIKTFTKSHDRFLIIDRETVYHIGASLKDLAKKWFAFSKIGLDANDMIKKIEN